jgi:hypothetical protein
MGANLEVGSAALLKQISPGARASVVGSVLESDPVKLGQFVQVAADEQAALVRCRLSLGVAWEPALEGRSLKGGEPVLEVERVRGAEPTRDPEPDAELQVELGGAERALDHEAPEQPAEATGPTRTLIERREVGELRPNKFNESLFPDSLSDAAIKLIADDLARNGQRVPVEITSDSQLVDGERRWRAARQLGWDSIDVVVVGDLSEEQIIDRVIDACTSSRQMSLREQVNVYQELCRRIKRDAGRERGRPSRKTMPDGISLDPTKIQAMAANQAGFSSSKQAVRAQAVFERGSEELKRQVLDGAVSLTAAYETLPKRGKKTKVNEVDVSAPTPVTDGATADDVRQEQHAFPNGAAVPDTGDHDAVAAVAHEGQDDEDLNLGTPGPNVAGEVQDDEDLDAQDQDLDIPGVQHHVVAVCRYVALLAERSHEDATEWVDSVINQLRLAVGEAQ